jgi:hypothetical protein
MGRENMEALIQALVLLLPGMILEEEDMIPRTDIDQIFDHIMTMTLGLGFDNFLQTFANRPLKIATICSGSTLA